MFQGIDKKNSIRIKICVELGKLTNFVDGEKTKSGIDEKHGITNLKKFPKNRKYFQESIKKIPTILINRKLRFVSN